MHREEVSTAFLPRQTREKDGAARLCLLEDLAEKKMRVYARLLTDVNLAKRMEEIADVHTEAKTTLKTWFGEVDG